MPSNHLILCHPLLLLLSFFPSIRVFSNESALRIRWPKYWSFSFNISPSSKHPGLISFRIGWIPLQSKGLSRVFSNTTVQKHQFFGAQLSLIVQLSHPYMTTGKNIALSRWTFAGKVMPLLFNMLSRLVIAFLPRSRRLNFMIAVTMAVALIVNKSPNSALTSPLMKTEHLEGSGHTWKLTPGSCIIQSTIFLPGTYREILPC